MIENSFLSLKKNKKQSDLILSFHQGLNNPRPDFAIDHHSPDLHDEDVNHFTLFTTTLRLVSLYDCAFNATPWVPPTVPPL